MTKIIYKYAFNTNILTSVETNITLRVTLLIPCRIIVLIYQYRRYSIDSEHSFLLTCPALILARPSNLIQVTDLLE